MDAQTFKFRASEVEELRILLGDFALMERPGQPSDLLLRLRAAGLVEQVPDSDPWVCFALTDAGKTLIKQALGEEKEDALPEHDAQVDR